MTEIASPSSDRSSDDALATGYVVVRVAYERFALPLAGVEEAVDSPEVRALAGLPAAHRGVLHWRGRQIPVVSPVAALGHEPTWPVAAVLVLAGREPIALGVDDVEDVVHLSPDRVRPLAGVRDPHEVLAGVARHGGALISLLDIPTLAALCAAPGGTPSA